MNSLNPLERSVAPRLPEAVGGRRRRRGHVGLDGRAGGAGGRNRRQAQGLHPPVDGRRPQPQGHLRPQARHRGRRRVQADPDGRARHRDQRAFPAVRQADERGRHPSRHVHQRRRPRPRPLLHAHRLQGRRRRPLLPQHRLHRVRGAGQGELPAAELRRRQRPQLRLRLPRAQAPAAVRPGPGPGRREPQAARRPTASSTTASVCWRRWSRPSTTTTRSAPGRPTKRPIAAPCR